MNEFTQKMGDMDRRIRELEDKLRAVRTPPTVVATPGKRLTLNDHLNVADLLNRIMAIEDRTKALEEA